MSFLATTQPLKSAFKHVRYFAMQTSNASSVRTARGLSYPPSIAPSLIRRLPQTIPFACAEGKEYFKEAMDHGNAEGFFGLMGNFSSNALPQHGGQTSLSMVLNSLEIDPKRKWKGAWRWYSTDLLEVCSSPNQIAQRGINFNEFACLAKNHCHVTKHQPSSTRYSEFLDHLGQTTAQTDSHMVVSFSRKAFGQATESTETGFAPVGGYNPAQNKVLLMDSSRSQFPCIWVDAELVYHAMADIDPLAGVDRGYLLLTHGNQLETSCTCPNKSHH